MLEARTESVEEPKLHAKSVDEKETAHLTWHKATRKGVKGTDSAPRSSESSRFQLTINSETHTVGKLDIPHKNNS